MILTNSQITTLRSKPHLSKLYLSIYQPSTVLACQVNDLTIAKGEMDITYDTVTTGSYLLIRSGMTLNVGSTLGGFDKGTVRVKSATSSVITVAENSHINWADGDYLTVVSFYEINAIYPRIIQDPADETNTLWYKDYDIVYTNQNSILGSFINMGSHFAGFLENGTCNVYYSSSGTYNLLGNSLTYDWVFEGASVTGSTANTPGNISYTTPGHYTTRLTVTDGSASDTSYRHISIYNKPGQGNTNPISKWELIDFSGSREQGGYTVKVKVYESVSPSVLRDGSLVVLFAEDWYGDTITKQSLGGNSLGRSSIVFSGYVLKNTIKYDWRDSSVEFQIGSPSEVMKLAEGFAVSIQYSDNPSSPGPDIPSGWVLVLGMDIKRALYHYLRWHSTVLMTNDFEFVGTDRYLQYFDADRTSIYDAIQQAMKSILVGNLVCDRQGKLWAERDIYIEPTAFPTTLTLTNQDWIGEAGIEESRTPRTSFIEMGGVAFNGSTYQALLANAPGVAPGYRGSVERIQGLALLNQTELNDIVGNIYAQRNILYPSLDLDLIGNYRNFDIAPQEKIPITLAATDTIRGITFSGKNFYLNQMSWQYDPLHELFLPKTSLIEIGSGFDGDTIYIPDIPDTQGYGEPTVPTVSIPSFDFGLGTSGSGTPSDWLPIITLQDNVGGSDLYPDAASEGGIHPPSVANEYQTAQHFIFHTNSPSGTANIYLVFRMVSGSNSFDYDSYVNLYSLATDSIISSDSTVGTSTLTGNKVREGLHMSVSWTGAGDYDIYIFHKLTPQTGYIIYLGNLIIWA